MKIIRDLVHGYIPLNENDIKIIDTPHFQRLKRIRQTGFYSPYPCANHTRFEHSLGVMYLGTKVLESIKEKSGTNAKKFTESLQNTTRYACLLHDVGHAPFSHIGESFFDKDALRTELCNELTSQIGTNRFTGAGGASHELCSCIVSLKKFGTDLISFDVDLELFCRMITGEKLNQGKAFENSLISILNSPTDVDKLDFVLRDSQMSGAQIVTLDVDRLISSYIFHNNTLAFSGKSLSTISSLIYGRDAVYTWIVNHHISIYSNCIFKRLIANSMSAREKKDFFSSDSIISNLIDDYDLIRIIRLKKDSNADIKIMYDNLFDRNYYTSLWKTKFEFEKILGSMNQDIFIETVRPFKENLEKLESIIVNRHPDLFTLGDFYMAFADFKPFIPIDGQEIYLKINDGESRFRDVFHNSIHKTTTKELPYIFVKDDSVKANFTTLLRNIDEIRAWEQIN
nr:HD domain-containing protein [uncultured Methanoregula sp.]